MILSKAMSMKQRKAKVQSLIDTFAANKSYFMSKEFNEAQTRAQFIDPFLECLQWDVKNEQGLRPDYRDVIPEDRIQVGERTKHPDYTLCCCGMRKIYVEAKQPSVDLKQNPEPALQVRRYAYSAKMPVAILTDFQEFAVYDTRIKPSAKDSAGTARIEYFTFDQYAEKFEELYRKFSYEAVSHGDFDTYFESAKDKKGTASVDNDILAMIEDWRTLLAEDIALHNTEIDEFNLTGSVQKIIDRILFLRICEDKEIESYDTLKNIAESKAGIYEKLKTLFDNADQKFNSGLFKKDSFTDGLNLQDKTLITIINALYYPICQYEFSVLPVEILGSIYERFLGKIIRFSRKTKNGHSVEVVEKPEVQKAGGVYYTPTYIVKYIVKNTIGKKIEGKTPEEVAAMHFVDPACGSGSFLIGAYQYLLDFHLNYYDTDKNRAKAEKKGVIYKDARTKEYKLSVEEKKRILVNNIYGVDIDAQAVEVTKLSLFLKLLENEGKALSGIANDLFKGSDMTGGKILPDMSGNIKCGNSLIGSDFYADKDLTLFGMEEQRKVNVFDWDKQFAAVFKNGGFDCVIGNPPYVLCQPGTTDEYLLNYYKNYHVASYKIDLFHLFFEKSIKLLNDSGLMGFITPNTYLTNKYIKVLREFILENTKVERIVNHDKVFDSVSVDVATIILNKNKSKDDSVIIQKTEKGVFIDVCTKKQKDWENDSEYVFNINESFSLTLKNTFNLGDSYSSYFGIQAFDRNSSISEEKINDDYLPIIDGEDIHPFDYSVPKKFFNYKKGNIKSGGDWSVYSLERIVVRQIGAVPVVGLCEKDILASNTLYSIWSKNDEYSLLYLLCILNSKTLKYIWASKYSDNKGLFPKIKGFQLKELPIPTATADQQQKLSSLATQMLDAHRQLGLAKSEADKAMLAQRIDILDA
ncbi:MAG: TaqI-like C-terminal specificity domain-containing protein, partial [Spirochaetales bacterium]|nr:TaqI-like C-terminal specificity domain-containing protein [Spirochaetales bacterium]